MARTRTATAKEKAPKVDDTPAEAPEGMRPKDLAAELSVNPKSLRAYLRRAFPRKTEAKNTSWYLSPDQVTAARENFAKKDEGTDEA